MEIFPLKFSKNLMKICSLEIFPLKMEIFPLKMKICSLSKSEEDEDGLEMMKINSWGKNDGDFFFFDNLDFEWE